MKSNLFLRLVLGAGLALLSQASAQTIEVTSTGVGIGTATPSTKLHVYGTSTGNDALLKSETSQSSGTNVGLWMTGGATNANWLIGTNRADIAGAADNLLFYKVTGSYGTKMVIRNDGNVGIGTTNPDYKFSVESSSNGRVMHGYSPGDFIFSLAGDGVAGSNLDLFSIRNNNTHVVHLNTINGARMALGVSTASSAGSISEHLSITSSGNVGIGTSSPGVPLEVAGQIMSNVSGGGSLSLKGSNSNSQPSIYFERSGGAVWAAGLTSDTSASLYINNGYGGGNVMTMTPAGNVGIGTASPGYKLEVSGSVRATSFIANSATYADFVFAPGYKLTPLSEVEAAIKAHGHLPDIPSKAEAEAHGVDLAAMQVKLLQKVEELTLYLVALDKDVKQLRAENEALRR